MGARASSGGGGGGGEEPAARCWREGGAGFSERLFAASRRERAARLRRLLEEDPEGAGLHIGLEDDAAAPAGRGREPPSGRVVRGDHDLGPDAGRVPPTRRAGAAELLFVEDDDNDVDDDHDGGAEELADTPPFRGAEAITDVSGRKQQNLRPIGVPFPSIPRQVQPEDDHDPESAIPFEVLQRVSEMARARGGAKRPNAHVPAAGVDRIAARQSYMAPVVGKPLAQIPEDSKLRNEAWDEDDEEDEEDEDEEIDGNKDEEEENDGDGDDDEVATDESEKESPSPVSAEGTESGPSAGAQAGALVGGEVMPGVVPDAVSIASDQKEAFASTEKPDRAPTQPKPSTAIPQQQQKQKQEQQSPGTPTGVSEPKDLDLRDVQFLPSMSKRGNRMGYIGTQLAELHVIKLRDLPTTARFTEEYSSNLRWLKHECLATILGVSKRKENLFVVATGFVEFTLQELLNTASEIPYPFVLRFAFQLCSVLSYLHQHELAHFNIHAHTVFMDAAQPPNLRLLDTGVGRAYQGSPFAVGNHELLEAPELHADASRRRKDGVALDGAAIDIFHFAFILWEMLAGVNAMSVTNQMKKKSKLRGQEASSSKMSKASSGASSETDSVEGERLHREIAENTRPPLLAVPPEFRSLLAQCWTSEPSQRLSVGELAQRVKKLILATRPPYEPLRFFSSQEGLDPRHLPICTPSAVRARRMARMLGKEALKLQVNLCVLQDIASAASGPRVLFDGRGDAAGQTLKFRKHGALSVRSLQLWRVEPLLRASSARSAEDDKPKQVLQHCREIRDRFANCPGLCMPHDFRPAPATPSEGSSGSNEKGVVLLDYVNGVSLQDILDRGGCVDPLFLARVAWGVLQGLGWMHRFGQPHGALCPRNILFDRAGNIILTGLHVSPSATAVRMEEIWRAETAELGFVAPEVLLGNARDPRGDIWSLGMCLWACASGKSPLTHITTFEQAHEYASSYSMTPNLDQELVSPPFRKFVRRCILSLREERPRSDELLLDDFLRDYVDYQPFSLERSDGSLVLVDPDDGKLREEPVDTESPVAKERATNRLERLIVRQEVAALTNAVRDTDLLSEVSRARPDVDRFANKLTSLASDHVHRLLASLWDPSLWPGSLRGSAVNDATEADAAFIAAKSETLMQELLARVSPGEQPAGAAISPTESLEEKASAVEAALLEMAWNVALVSGQMGDSEFASGWGVYLAKLLWRQGILGLSEASLAHQNLLDAVHQTRIPRVVVLDAASDGLEILFEVSAALRTDADLFVLSARPNEQILDAKGESISRAGFAEVVLARLALMYVLLARQGSIILHEQGDPVLYSIASFGRKREPYEGIKARYDVFVGCPLEGDGDAQNASQVIVSWLATKPSELLLAWARHDDAENVSHFLERLVTLELSSSVLFYFFPADSRAYSGMVRAIAHAVCGKPVIAVFGRLPEPGTDGSEPAASADVRRARALFYSHVGALLSDAVHIFDAEQMDEAIELAISISMLSDSAFLKSLEALPETGDSTAPPEASSLSSQIETDGFSSTVQKLVETWDQARVLEDLGDANLSGTPSWSIPGDLHTELETASHLVRRTLSAVSGIAVGSEPPSFADPNLEVAVQALPSAFDRSASSLSSSSSSSSVPSSSAP